MDDNNKDKPTALQLRSLIKPEGELEVTLASVPIPVPGDDEVLVRLQGAPINPSDLGLLFGAADMGTAEFSGDAAHPVLRARVPEAAMRAMAGRAGQSGNARNGHRADL